MKRLAVGALFVSLLAGSVAMIIPAVEGATRIPPSPLG